MVHWLHKHKFTHTRSHTRPTHTILNHSWTLFTDTLQGSGSSQCDILVHLLHFFLCIFSVKNIEMIPNEMCWTFFLFLNEMTKITLKKNKGNTSTQVKQKKKRKQKIHKYSVAPYKTSTIYFIRLCIALFYIILRSARKEHQLLPFALGDKKSNTNQTMWIFSFFFSLLVLPWCKKGAYTHPFTLTQIAANTCK